MGFNSGFKGLIDGCRREYLEREKMAEGWNKLHIERFVVSIISLTLLG